MFQAFPYHLRKLYVSLVVRVPPFVNHCAKQSTVATGAGFTSPGALGKMQSRGPCICFLSTALCT